MTRVFYGWWIVLATCIIHFLASGTFYHSFTAFFNPIQVEFGWTYAAMSFAASLRSIEGGIASPIVGIAADRYGARRLLLLGALLSGSGFILFSRITSLWSYYAAFVFLSIGSSLFFPLPGFAAAANWFQKKRGLVFGILSAFAGVGGLMIYVANGLIGIYGWRTTLFMLGVATWVVGIPCAAVVRHRPETYGLRPDGARPLNASKDTEQDLATTEPREFSTREALRTRAFWFLTIVVITSGAAVHAVMVHIMPHLISMRMDRGTASLLASLAVFISISGRFGVAWLGDRVRKWRLLAVCQLSQAVGLWVVADANTVREGLLFILLFAPAYGAVITMRLTIQGEYFGRKAFGAIQGLLITALVLGTISSTYLTGLIFDLHGKYYWAWITMALLILCSVPLALWTRPPSRPTETTGA